MSPNGPNALTPLSSSIINLNHSSLTLRGRGISWRKKRSKRSSLCNPFKWIAGKGRTGNILHWICFSVHTSNAMSREHNYVRNVYIYIYIYEFKYDIYDYSCIQWQCSLNGLVRIKWLPHSRRFSHCMQMCFPTEICCMEQHTHECAQSQSEYHWHNPAITSLVNYTSLSIYMWCLMLRPGIQHQ